MRAAFDTDLDCAEMRTSGAHAAPLTISREHTDLGLHANPGFDRRPCMTSGRPRDIGDKEEGMGTERSHASQETKSQAAHLDEALDEALKGTFPASDPIAISFEPASRSPAPGTPGTHRRSDKPGAQRR